MAQPVRNFIAGKLSPWARSRKFGFQACLADQVAIGTPAGAKLDPTCSQSCPADGMLKRLTKGLVTQATSLIRTPSKANSLREMSVVTGRQVPYGDTFQGDIHLKSSTEDAVSADSDMGIVAIDTVEAAQVMTEPAGPVAATYSALETSGLADSGSIEGQMPQADVTMVRIASAPPHETAPAVAIRAEHDDSDCLSTPSLAEPHAQVDWEEYHVEVHL